MKSPHVFTFWLAKVDNLDALDDGAVLLEPGQEGLDVTFSGAEQLPVEIVRLQLADLERTKDLYFYLRPRNRENSRSHLFDERPDLEMLLPQLLGRDGVLRVVGAGVEELLHQLVEVVALVGWQGAEEVAEDVHGVDPAPAGLLVTSALPAHAVEIHFLRSKLKSLGTPETGPC